jgi:hypothetical protein
MTSNTSAAKNWAFTINNYDDDKVELLSNLVSDGKCQYVVFGMEVGEEGTPHLQGYLQLPKRLRFNQVKSLIGGTGHIDREHQNSTPTANQTYCKKSGDFIEFGTISHKAGRCPHMLCYNLDLLRIVFCVTHLKCH